MERGGGSGGTAAAGSDRPPSLSREEQEWRKKEERILSIIRSGNLRKLKRCDPKDVLKTSGSGGWTSLCHACAVEDLAIAKYLLQLKADVHATNHRGQTALHLATYHNSVPILRELLAAKAKVNTSDAKGHTPLFMAAEKGSVEMAKLLVEEGKANVDARSARGWTCFLIAVRKGQTRMVKYLLEEAGADVTVATKRMHTAAHIAAQYGPAPLLRIVARHARKLETGPVRHFLEFNRKHKHGIRCQWVLQHLGHLAASPPVLVNRATTREIKIVYGFGAGMSRTTTAHNGTVPLHIAAHKGSVGCVLELLKAKAAPLQTDSMGRTARSHAFHAYRTAETLSVLKKWSTPLCCPTATTMPCTTLSSAALRSANHDHADCARFLLRAKAAVDMYDFNVTEGLRPYSTPLTVAAGSGNEGVAKVLLRAGAHVEGIRGCETMLLFSDSSGDLVLPEAISRPLLLAAVSGHTNIVRLLCEAKANVQAQSPLLSPAPQGNPRYCSTPLIAAARAGHVDIVRILLEAGANPAGTDSLNKTALEAAKELAVASRPPRITRPVVRLRPPHRCTRIVTQEAMSMVLDNFRIAPNQASSSDSGDSDSGTDTSSALGLSNQAADTETTASSKKELIAEAANQIVDLLCQQKRQLRPRKPKRKAASSAKNGAKSARSRR